MHTRRTEARQSAFQLCSFPLAWLDAVRQLTYARSITADCGIVFLTYWFAIIIWLSRCVARQLSLPRVLSVTTLCLRPSMRPDRPDPEDVLEGSTKVGALGQIVQRHIVR
jgi:hypothetical protein